MVTKRLDKAMEAKPDSLNKIVRHRDTHTKISICSENNVCAVMGPIIKYQGIPIPLTKYPTKTEREGTQALITSSNGKSEEPLSSLKLSQLEGNAPNKFF